MLLQAGFKPVDLAVILSDGAKYYKYFSNELDSMQRLLLKISQKQVKIPHTMNAEAFCLLSDENREDILTLEGTHIGQREANGLFFDLYQVQGFYVEFCYQLGRSSKVTTEVFADMDLLDPYLSEEVSLSSLVRLASS